MYFKPAGVPARELRTTSILLDELEAMRLVDGEGLKQTEAAGEMDVSQSTIARLLAAGRKKTALALAHGEALKLQQGDAPLDFQQPRGCGKGPGRNQGQPAGNPIGRGTGTPRGGGGPCRGAGRGGGRGR